MERGNEGGLYIGYKILVNFVDRIHRKTGHPFDSKINPKFCLTFLVISSPGRIERPSAPVLLGNLINFFLSGSGGGIGEPRKGGSGEGHCSWEGRSWEGRKATMEGRQEASDLQLCTWWRGRGRRACKGHGAVGGAQGQRRGQVGGRAGKGCGEGTSA